MRAKHRRTRRHGSTLVEVLVALLVTVLLVHGLAATVDAARAAGRAAQGQVHQNVRATNGRRVLRQVVRDIARAATQAPFSGTAAHARFTSTCLAAFGWQHACEVELFVSSDAERGVLVAQFDGQSRDTLIVTRGPLELRYLVAAHDGGQWLRTWEASVQPPLALGLLIGDEIAVVLPVASAAP